MALLGGGVRGDAAGRQLRQAGMQDLRLIESAGDFGGTWYWNRYPGAACDIESYIYLPRLRKSATSRREKYSRAPEILEHSRTLRGTSASRARLSADRGDGSALGRCGVPLVDRHEPRRSHAGALRRDGERSAAPAEASGHPGGGDVHRPRLPHEPLGLRLYRRLERRQPDRPERQGGRRHRHRSDGRTMRAAPGGGGEAPLRLPAHAIVDRCARQ